jgi:hypothetical protein
LQELASWRVRWHGKLLSGQNAVDYVAVNAGQAEVAPAVAICQPRVVEAEQMQNCRVKVVDMDLADGYLIAILFWLAVDNPELDTSARHPRWINEVMMPPTVRLVNPRRATVLKLNRLEDPKVRGGERSNASVNRELELLRAILNFAHRQNWISKTHSTVTRLSVSKTVTPLILLSGWVLTLL